MRLPAAAALIAAAICLATHAAAQAQSESPMSAEEFDAYATGRTLIYGDAEGPYGIEEYLPGRRVRWSFLDDDCIDGRWFGQGDAICFAYEGRQTPVCWLFFLQEDGLLAQPLSGAGGALYEISRSRAPMVCKGPRVGV